MTRLDVPEEFGRVLVSERIAYWAPPVRGLVTDLVVVTIGTGGSLVSLMQGPQVLHQLAVAVQDWIDRSREEVVLSVGRRSDGTLSVVVGPGADPRAVVEFLSSALQPSSAPE
jgi:hypothetical protein